MAVTVGRRTHWGLLAEGVVAIIFGLIVLVVPRLILSLLAFFFAIFVLLYGIFAILTSLRERRTNRLWWVMLLEGIVAIAICIITIFWSHITATIFIALFAAWSIITGVLKIIGIFRRGATSGGRWFTVLSGLLSIVVGIVLVLQLGADLATLVRLIGVYAIIFGILQLVNASQHWGAARPVATQRMRQGT